MLPPLEVVARLRPLDLVAPGTGTDRVTSGTSTLFAAPRPAPYAAVVAELRHVDHRTGRVLVGFGSGATRLAAWYDPDTGDVGLDITDAAIRTTTHRSRRHGRVAWRPDKLALTLTGTHVSAFCHEDARWVLRGRVDVKDLINTHDEHWLSSLKAGHRSESALVRRVHAGAFGQLGLRDIRLVTEADGTPCRDGSAYWLTATSAGPGFFDTAHASVWRFDPDRRTPGLDSLQHTGDLYFRRPDRPGVYGDHALHLVRDAGRWLVATSTWGDFNRETNASVRVTLAESTDDLLHGEHVLDTRELPLPTDGFRSVGVWDPHLVREDETWHVGYASASKFFKFHPCVASGPSLDALTLRAADTDRRATEGVTLLRIDGTLRVLASDGRDSPRGLRARFPVLDLDLDEVGELTAPYPTNLPWPTLLETEQGWTMVTFNGASTGGPLVGYGTHGDVVVMRESRRATSH
ncbi:hypothetical protein [Nocardioides sp. 616]|uniref:hypothetical protein n=1 Tax=Nocardioides sp. 616 TaxID=2268090 RepID=UPI000CE3A2EF|nr:hypothetical protein [Nocardioides sp. 616]